MQRTLGLQQNPFDPDWPGLGRLAGKPLSVDVDPKLLDLVCWDLGGLKSKEADLCWALFDEPAGKDVAVKRDVILIVLGAQGSGRSTLASLVCRRVLDSSKAGGGDWTQFKGSFPTYPATMDPAVVKQECDRIKQDVTRKFSEHGPGRALVLVDNLPKCQFDAILDLFHGLPGVSRVFIVTTDDESLKERDLDAAGPRIELAERPKLTPEDVRAFIAHRVPKYRCDGLASIADDPDLSLFPFTATAPASAVGGSGSRPVRGVNSWLVKQLERRHRELVEQQNNQDIAQIDLSELRARMIG
jgi:hypothetical protein